MVKIEIARLVLDTLPSHLSPSFLLFSVLGVEKDDLGLRNFIKTVVKHILAYVYYEKKYCY